MKKNLLSIVAVAAMVVSSATAQENSSSDAGSSAPDLKSKKGYVILPEAGDYSLGMNAVPLIDLALNSVNIMNNTGQTAQHPGYVSGFNQIISAKRFTSSTEAYRVRLGINTLNTTTKTYGDNPLTPSAVDPENVLLQTTSTSNSSYFVSLGKEWRRGHNRLQGFYGAEAILGFAAPGKTVNKFETAYDQTAVDSAGLVAGDSRVLVNKQGPTFSIGARGFVGVEYFVAPKISIGAEFGWGLGFSTTFRGKTETEFWEKTPGQAVASKETDNGANSSRQFALSVDNGMTSMFGSSAALMVNFHF